MLDLGPARREDAEQERTDRDAERHQRPGDGDPELGAGGGHLALQLGHPAEHPQRDAADLDAVAARDDRVPQLVDQDRCEEQQRRRGRDGEGLVAVTGQHVLVAARQEPDPEEEHDEPARVDPDADSHHGDQMYGAAAAHQSMLKGSVLWLTK